MGESSETAVGNERSRARFVAVWVVVAVIAGLIAMWTVTDDPMKRVTVAMSGHIFTSISSNSAPREPNLSDFSNPKGYKPKPPAVLFWMTSGGGSGSDREVISNVHSHYGWLNRGPQPFNAFGVESWLGLGGDERSVFAAVTATQDEYVIYVAPAASESVAATLETSIAEYLDFVNPGVNYRFVDLGANPNSDPYGYGLTAGLTLFVLLMLVFGAWSGLRRTRRDRAVLRFVLEVLGIGLVYAMVLRYPLGLLTGTWWHSALPISLGGLALALPAMYAAVKWRGRGVAAVSVTFLLTGMPFLVIPMVFQLTRPVWNQLTQFFPVGAMETLLRQWVFFHGYGIARPLVVLVLWAGISLLLLRRELAPPFEPYESLPSRVLRPEQIPAQS
jgi:hypothetical protein